MKENNKTSPVSQMSNWFWHRLNWNTLTRGITFCEIFCFVVEPFKKQNIHTKMLKLTLTTLEAKPKTKTGFKKNNLFYWCDPPNVRIGWLAENTRPCAGGSSRRFNRRREISQGLGWSNETWVKTQIQRTTGVAGWLSWLALWFALKTKKRTQKGWNPGWEDIDDIDTVKRPYCKSM